MSIWDAAKLVTAEEAAQVYGIEVDRAHKALCPFHPDKKSKSLSFKNGYFTCFGCNKHGDSITLVSELFSTTRAEAAKRLNADFALNLTDEPPNPLDALRMAHRRSQEAERKAYAQYAHDILDHAERVINQSTATDWDELWQDVPLMLLLWTRHCWEPLLDNKEYSEDERKEVERVNAIIQID